MMIPWMWIQKFINKIPEREKGALKMFSRKKTELYYRVRDIFLWKYTNGDLGPFGREKYGQILLTVEDAEYEGAFAPDLAKKNEEEIITELRDYVLKEVQHRLDGRNANPWPIMTLEAVNGVLPEEKQIDLSEIKTRFDNLVNPKKSNE